ncbi:MAG: hypothetical protein HYR84_13455 [Planctomycetes bacterium]|nr:hypothetical protein [Planctomycetota bacterium]
MAIERPSLPRSIRVAVAILLISGLLSVGGGIYNIRPMYEAWQTSPEVPIRIHNLNNLVPIYRGVAAELSGFLVLAMLSIVVDMICGLVQIAAGTSLGWRNPQGRTWAIYVTITKLTLLLGNLIYSLAFVLPVMENVLAQVIRTRQLPPSLLQNLSAGGMILPFAVHGSAALVVLLILNSTVAKTEFPDASEDQKTRK